MKKTLYLLFVLSLVLISVHKPVHAENNGITIDGKEGSYETIQSAIDDAVDGDIIRIAHGLYKETLTIEGKSITLSGPNKDIPGTGSRLEEAIITYPDGVDPLSIDLLSVDSDDVTIEGLNFENLTTSSGHRNTAEVRLKGSNHQFINNRVISTSDKLAVIFSQEISESPQEPTLGNNLVKGNYISSTTSYSALYLQSHGVTVENNTIIGGQYGLQIQPYANEIGGLIRNNTIGGYTSSIIYNYAYKSSGDWTIQYNDLFSAPISNPFFSDWLHDDAYHGLSIISLGYAGTNDVVKPHLTFTNNTIDGESARLDPDRESGAVGIEFINRIHRDATYTIENNTFKNVDFGARQNATLHDDFVFDAESFLDANNFEANYIVDGQNVVLDSFVVEFRNPDGSVIESQNVKPNQSATAPSAPLVEGKTFVEWNVPFDKVNSNLIVTPIYETNVYTVTFVDYNDKVIGTVDVEHGSNVTAPSAPTRTGFIFTRWDHALENIKNDVTIKPLYQKEPSVSVGDDAPKNVSVKGLENAVTFTDEELALGAQVEIEIATLDEKDVPKEDLASLEAHFKDAKPLVYFLDISLYKVIGDNADSVRILDHPITISFTLPESFKNTPFNLVRIHDGEVDVLTYTYDPETNTVTFETDRFSTYALVSDVEGTDLPDAPTLPETGSPNTSLYIALGTVVLGLGIVLIGIRKKNKKM